MLVTINIDGQTYEVPEDQNLLQACLQLGLDLPYFCWHPAMGSVGSCRQCAVQQYANEEDERGRLVMACMTPVTPDMRISIEQDSVKQFRETSIEVIMANHPHDCPVCEEGGECHLQDMTLMSGHNTRSYRGDKKTYLNQDLGPCIGHEMNRCISCYRCVRFYNDYAGGKDLQAMASRENVYFGRFADGTLESPFSGNLVEVCPTGVFTDKPFNKSFTRKWDLQSAPSICTNCSLGCNVSPNERYGKIKRVVSRYHDQINGYFLCDRGRYGYEYSNTENRPLEYGLKLSDAGYSQVSKSDFWIALESQIASLSQADLIGVGSSRASVEENQLLKTLVGDQNYFGGTTDHELELLQSVANIYQSDITKSASLKTIEQADALIIIGEDLINTAPMMALSVRQASRNKSFDMAKQARIPLWQDASVRTLAQNELSPITQLNVYPNDLDEISSQSIYESPEKLAKIVEDIALKISGKKATNGTDGDLLEVISSQLINAKFPCVIAGTSLGSVSLAAATERLIIALNRARSEIVSIAMVVKDSNSIGLALSKPVAGVQGLVDRLNHQPPKTIICVKSDLYEAEHVRVLDQLWQQDHRLVVIDDMPTRTQRASDFFIPGATTVETEGTLINNEGRAQRFFAVHNGMAEDNWRSLVQIQKIIDPTCRTAACQTFDDVVADCMEQEDILSCLSQIAPDAKFNRYGLKIPRQSHRYSGRTSMNAAVQIHEPKQPVELDSGLAFSMEGAPLYQASPLNSITWSPGWNSNEALHRFQQEINGPLKEANAEVLIFEQIQAVLHEPKNTIPDEITELNENQVIAIRKPNIFGSEVQSSCSASLKSRFPKAVIGIHPETAANMQIEHVVNLKMFGHQISLSIQTDERLPKGLITVPDLPTINEQVCLALLPAIVTLLPVTVSKEVEHHD